MPEARRDDVQSSIEMFNSRIQVMDRHMESLTRKVEAPTNQIGKLSEHTIETQNIMRLQGGCMDVALNRIETLIQQQGQQQATLIQQLNSTLQQQGQQQVALMQQIDSTIKQQGQQQYSLQQQQLSIIQALITRQINSELSQQLLRLIWVKIKLEPL